jgi:hypothetical protein
MNGPPCLLHRVVNGGSSKDLQCRAIMQSSPRLLVATPGRLLDLVEMRVLDLGNVRCAAVPCLCCAALHACLRSLRGKFRV